MKPNTPRLNAVIDLSHHNIVTSFAKIRADNIFGVIHKATQGLHFVDDQYAKRKPLVRNNGMMHGAYHFGEDDDGAAQADFFLKVAQPDERTLLALDWEQNTAAGGTMTLAQAQAFVQRIYDETGRWPWLYSGSAFLRAEFAKGTAGVLANCPLWLAQYAPRPILPSYWKCAELWQYTDKGDVDGVVGDVDREYFAGSLNDLRVRWGYPALP